MGFWPPALPREPFCSTFSVSQMKGAAHGVCGKLYFQTDGLPHILYLRELSGQLLELLDNHVFLKAVPAWHMCAEEQMGCLHGMCENNA